LPRAARAALARFAGDANFACPRGPRRELLARLLAATLGPRLDRPPLVLLRGAAGAGKSPPPPSY
jgi:hypothetical protein